MSERRDIIDKVIVMLASGVRAETAADKVVETFDLEPSEASEVIEEARKAITVAADFDRIAEIGQAYVRLNNLYTRSIQIQDNKTALAVQREINKLVDLYGDREPVTVSDGQSNAEAQQELTAIAEHLLPLELAPAEYPLREHARIAAGIVRQST